VLPLQQPLGHDVASQTHCPVVRLHSCPAAQAPQVAPPVPHEALDSEAYVWHVPLAPPLQQPAGQVTASHEQVPLVVSHSPFAQLLHAAPPVPQRDDNCEE
jgi:hypothetical protein